MSKLSSWKQTTCLDKELAIEQLRDLLESEAITEQEFRDLKLQREQELADQLSEIEKEKLDLKKEQIAIEMQLENQKRDNAIDSSLAILGSIASAAGEGTAIAKAAGVAQATIDTYKAAVAAYAAGSSQPKRHKALRVEVVAVLFLPLYLCRQLKVRHRLICTEIQMIQAEIAINLIQ